MPLTPVAEEDLIPLLEQGATLLTVNRRLSRLLQHRYHQHQLDQDRMAWETPDILPWTAWLSRCLDQAAYQEPEQEPPLLLTPEQELAVWEAIIRESPQAWGLLHLSQAASRARQAWLLCRHWLVPDEVDPLLWTSPDHEAFWEWSQEFAAHTDSQGWLDTARQPEEVIRLLESGLLSCPQVCILAGFDSLPPIQERLVQALRSQGCSPYELHFPAQTSQAAQVCFPDQEQEIQAAALWVRTHLHTSPQEQIGIIVPDLARLRPDVVRTFDRILHPDAEHSPLPPQERAYNLSLGQPLTAYPLVQAALHGLDLIQDPIPVQTLSAVLTSPFFLAGQRELTARGSLEAALREIREPGVSWRHFLHHQEKNGTCPNLLQAGRDVFTRLQDLPQTQAPSAWAGLFSHLLQDLGWPGERSLDSAEYQTVQAFNRCLQALAGLDRILPRLTWSQARHRLERILNQTVFQPEGSEVQIQIMGMLEAVGERFDRLWIMGLTDQTWPPPSDPNPFVPVALQRQMGMPRSSPEHELTYAREVTERLIQSAPEVILSYPAQEEDRELLPSPLLAGLPHVAPEDLGLEDPLNPWLNRPKTDWIQTFQDAEGPALVPGSQPKGGTGLLRSQAACPFQAFARHRLGAESLQQPIAGLGPPERGTLMHTALETFWRTCQDQATLLTLSYEQLQEWVDQAVHQAIRDMRRRRPLTFTSEFTDMETERLHTLLVQWLELETRRSPFQVHSLEERFHIHIQGLELNVVADRLDRLDNGQLVVIDYKSGTHSMSEWIQDRPVEPQVPLYSLFSPEPVAGVYFGVVRKGECAFVGLGRDSDIVPECKGFAEHKLTREYASWEDLLADWRHKLENLALEVMQGQAQVAPKTPQTCRQCDLHALCRIFELS